MVIVSETRVLNQTFFKGRSHFPIICLYHAIYGASSVTRTVLATEDTWDDDNDDDDNGH